MSLTGIDRCRGFRQTYPCPDCTKEDPESHSRVYELAYTHDKYWCPTCHHYFNKTDWERIE